MERYSSRSFRCFLWIASLGMLADSKSYLGTSRSIIDPARVKQISWKPRAFVYEGLLTDSECDHLISLAKPELRRSAVVDPRSKDGSAVSEVRTSTGMFIARAKDPIVTDIEEKIATWTFLPADNGEGIQVLRYEYGQKYDPHHDFFDNATYHLSRGGNRMATVLMYLSDVEKGGETVFPSAKEAPPRSEEDTNLTECGKQGIAVKPRKGDALLFFSLQPNSNPDSLSLHGGCPVIEGEKWSATKWIHVDGFNKILKQTGCADLHENCEEWASRGECTKNSLYMVGSNYQQGNCRKSCKACSLDN